jgi:hypothetical protein
MRIADEQKTESTNYQHLYPKTDILEYVNRIEEAIRNEKEQGVKAAQSKQPSLFRLQHELSTAIDHIALSKLCQLAKDNQSDTARLKQLRHKTSLSHLWLSVIPSDPTLVIPTVVMKLSIRFRLGLTPHTTMPSQCVCSTANAFQLDPYHAFTCSILRSHGSIFRHNLLLNSIATWTKRAGILTEVEVSQLCSDGRLRPDIVLSIGSEMRIVDVTVVHSQDQPEKIYLCM